MKRYAWIASTLIIFCVVFASSGVASAACPNEALRQQQGSTHLPDCRGYEQVSPGDKNGATVGDVLRVSGDGQGIAWTSNGAYADPLGVNVLSAFVASRTASGWTTKAVHPAYGPEARPELLTVIGGYLFPADLSRMVFISNGSYVPDDKDHGFGPFGTQDVYSIDLAGSLSWPSQGEGFTGNAPIPAQVEGLSEDGSSVFLRSAEPLTPDVPSDFTASQLYRWRDGHLEAVGRSESGSLLEGEAVLGIGTPFVAPGAGEAGRLGTAEGTSADGSKFFYSGTDAPGGVRQIYLHEDGHAPKLVSSSQRTGTVGDPAASPATFVTATPDLRKAYFVCHAQLTDDAPADGGAYVYDTATGELEFSNPDQSDSPNALEAGWRGLSKLSSDGSYRYFVETAALAPGAVEGQPNLYVQHQGARQYIATLSQLQSDKGVGVATSPDGFPRSPGLTSTAVSDDGRRFAFASSRSLTEADSAGHPQVYLYDTPSETLTCVSCRPDGSASEADSTLLQKGISTSIWTPRVFSPDGRGVIFTSGDRLVGTDRNDADDVYQWRDGVLSLISSGQGKGPSVFVGMGPDGRDIYFKTAEALTRSDADGGLIDVYDARVGGGFDEPSTAPQCADDGCQGTPSSPPALSGPAAITGATGPKARRSHGRCKARKGRARKSASCAKANQRKHKAKKARQRAKERRDLRKGH